MAVSTPNNSLDKALGAAVLAIWDAAVQAATARNESNAALADRIWRSWPQ